MMNNNFPMDMSNQNMIINNQNIINNNQNMMNNNNNYQINESMSNMINIPIGSGMGIMINNIKDDEEECLEGFKLVQEELKSQENIYNVIGSGPKINVIFRNTRGDCHSLVVNYGVTIDELLKEYLKRIGRPDLIGDNRISYIWNASKLKFGDKTTVEKYFRNVNNPKVVVNDTHFTG